MGPDAGAWKQILEGRRRKALGQGHGPRLEACDGAEATTAKAKHHIHGANDRCAGAAFCDRLCGGVLTPMLPKRNAVYGSQECFAWGLAPSPIIAAMELTSLSTLAAVALKTAHSVHHKKISHAASQRSPGHLHRHDGAAPHTGRHEHKKQIRTILLPLHFRPSPIIPCQPGHTLVGPTKWAAAPMPEGLLWFCADRR